MRIPKIQVHPKTGEELKPIYVTRRGRVVWPQMGASPDDPDDGDGDGGADDDADDSDDDASGDGDGGDSGKRKGDAVTREEFEAVMRRMKAADKRASDAENKLKKIDDDKKDELTKATERAEAAEARTKELEAKLLDADLRDAFGQVDGVSWRKPGVALRIARADGYLDDVVNDGEVDTKLLAKKVKEFAEAYPELVKSGEDGGAGSNGVVTPPTGQPAGSGRRKPGKPDDSAIKERYGHLLR